MVSTKTMDRESERSKRGSASTFLTGTAQYSKTSLPYKVIYMINQIPVSILV